MNWIDFRLSKRPRLASDTAEWRYTQIAEIDAIKNTFRLTGKLLPQTLERLTRSVIVTSTGPSNRIGGKRRTDGEVEALYRSMRAD
jgi:hypothetical protein